MARRYEIPAWILASWAMVLVLVGPDAARAQQEPAVQSGVQYLRAHYAGKSAGESAMIALGLLKAEVPPSDPAVQACIAKIRTRFTSSAYQPGDGGRSRDLRGDRRRCWRSRTWTPCRTGR